MKNARYYAVKLLERTLTEQGYSNLLLDKTLSEVPLSPEDRRLCTQLYYGVAERLLTLRHIVRCYSKKPLEKLDLSVLCILYTGLYQLKYCDRIPDNAAVNESVRLTKQLRKSSASGFVNAVLRSFLRDEKKIRIPEDPLSAMEVEYSAPKALIARIARERGKEFAACFFADSLRTPPVTVRLNPLRGSRESLEADGLLPRECAKLDNAFFAQCQDIRKSRAYLQGMFHVQDLSSQICCAALAPQPGETILDLCAAPGGKSFTIAERMENKGRVLSFDLHAHRVKLIAEGAARLGLDCVEAGMADASVYDPDIPAADRVLCDVPCSGYGVIRRKPEIKYKPMDQGKDLPALQSAILENGAKYVKKGGILVYSTCTLLRAENEEVVENFLHDHPEFSTAPLTEFGFSEKYTVLSAQYADCDGFFIARMRKRGDADGEA